MLGKNSFGGQVFLIIILILAFSPAICLADHVHNISVRKRLLEHYSDWAGTRYQLGGVDANGIDCSSFIQNLFKDKFQVALPRSSREQMTQGERVDLENLRAGDLLFFRTGSTRRHVGVYVGNNLFMHVSAREGVELSKLFNPYWQRHFITARRIHVIGFKMSAL